MASELVVTPGGYRPPELVHKIGTDLRLRILTGRIQGVDASDSPVVDYGSVPRDGGNPALTPGYALPPGEETPEGSEQVPSLGRGWIAFAHWTNEGNELVSSFRSSWRVPPEPVNRAEQTIFLFSAMQDTIPMTLIPALQWGPSAAGGGEYWSVASWYIGGTTGAVFHGELIPVSVGDELTGVISLTGRQRAHCDYRSGFEELPEADLPVFKVRDLSRCGVVMAAYGIQECSAYPDSNAMGFRNIEVMTGFRRPALAWTPVNTITDCGQHVFVLSDANPGGEVDIHFRQLPVEPAVEPVAAEAGPEEIAAEPLVAAGLEAEPEVAEEAAATPDEATAEPLVAAAVEVAPEIAVAEAEPAQEPVMAEAPAAAPEEVAPAPLATAEPEPLAVTAPTPEPAVASAETEAPSFRLQVAESAMPVPSLEVHPRIDRLVEITIHNHSPGGPTSGDFESRLARLEAALNSLTQLLSATVGQPQASADDDGDVAARLERLVQLQRTGALTDDEFAAVKTQVIGGPMSSNGAKIASEAVLP